MRQVNSHNLAVADVFNLIEALRDQVQKEMRAEQLKGRLLPDSQVVYTEKVFNMILDYVDKTAFQD